MNQTAAINESLIIDTVGETFADRGRRYFEQGRVLEAEWEPESSLLQGAVQGRLRVPYRVRVQLIDGDSAVGDCSCPVGSDCKHVAAVMYAWLAKEDDSEFVEVDESEEQAPIAGPGMFAFGQWLGGLDRVQDGSVVHHEYPENIKQRLLYILESDGDRDVRLSFISTRILKAGGYGASQPYDAANILTYSAPRYVLAGDEKVLRAVATDRSLASMHGYCIKGPDGLKLLKQMVNSGRCHWRSKDSNPLKRGERRTGAWAWQLNPRGDQHLTLRLAAGEIVVPTSPPWYIDTEAMLCGPVDSGQPADVAEILLNIPPLELECSEDVISSVKRQLPDGVPVPVALLHEFRQVSPLPLLRLKSMKLSGRWGYRSDRLCHIAELLFDYDGVRVAGTETGDSVRTIRGEKVIDYRRDRQAEAAALQALERSGLYPAGLDDDQDHIPASAFTLDRDDSWPEWMLYEVPELKAEGFVVEVGDSFGFRLEQAVDWQLDLDRAGGSAGDGLMGEARFTVTLDSGESIDLIDALSRWVGRQPELLRAESLQQFKAKSEIALPLADGRLLPVPGAMVAGILHNMMDLFAAGGGAVQLSAPQMLALEAELQEMPLRINSSVWLQQMRQLAAMDCVPAVPVPVSLRAQLRDYQCEGLNWMQFLRRAGLGGILADDMGLGKTVQALAHILAEKEAGRLQGAALVLAPTSLMFNWRREAEKFAPDLSVLVLHGPERSRYFNTVADYDLVLTTYPLLARDFEVLEAESWHLLILDEAQYIKNPRAKISQLARRLNARHKLCMTGTPMENHLGELWSQFDFLMPGYLHDMRTFTKLFRKPIEIEGDQARQQALNVRLRPFLLRRAKEEVALELPPKSEIIRSVEIEGGQLELYESVRLAMQKRVRDAVASMGMAQSQIVVLDALLKMRQVCCDPRLVAGLSGKPPASAKLDELMAMLPELIEEGRRVLLFSQFTSMLSLIEEAVRDRDIAYVKLTGKTKDRQAPVEQFQNGEVPLFLISLRAGGVGLNLTAADTVIHFDPWWNPAAEAQATDRAHRIGQDKAVFVYKLITEGTVEERILELQQRKRALAGAIHQQGEAGGALWSEAELEGLFASLG